MKKLILPATYVFFFILLFCSLSVNAQGINQIWGTTLGGGQADMGLIFNTNSTGDNFKSRYSFTIKDPGASPTGNLIEYNGKFYGMTGAGGQNNLGVIFEYDIAGNVYTKMFDFSVADGRTPNGSLTLMGDKFYGVTSRGGVNDAGVIFEWNPTANVYTKKIDFNFTGGYYPVADLTLSDGKFYGTTAAGGAGDKGVIFEWDPVSNLYTEKFDLSNDTDGSNFIGNLKLYGSKLYGMTVSGGSNNQGVIFEWDPVSNIYTKKKDFKGIDGGNTRSSLTLNANKFYGMAGGGITNEGVIFEWDPATNIYAKKVDLSITSGRYPRGSLTFSAGKFYGMTDVGGINDAGVIFVWDPITNVYVKKIDLSVTNGSDPFGSLTLSGNKFYGMTLRGGSQNQGVIFEWDTATNVYTKKIQFNYSDGFIPDGKQIYSSGKLYGYTRWGGINGLGTIYEWDLTNNHYSKKIDLSYQNGWIGSGTFSLYNKKIYGLAGGGGNGEGVIFEWEPISNVYTKKIDFSNANGNVPTSLTLYNGKFYGTTADGGSNGGGVLFVWDPVTNVYTKKIELSVPAYDDPPIDGQSFEGLVLSGNKFYGSTSLGGINNAGVIFEYDPASNVYTKKIDFPKGNGSAVDQATFKLYHGKFYGTIFVSGSNGVGFIYEWDPVTNVFIKKIDLSPSDGTYPSGSLTLSGDKFYGMTAEGGDYNNGVLYQWDPVSNIYTKKKDFNDTDGASPGSNALTLVPAPVTKGSPGSCVSFPDITIDNSNNNVWVPIVDTLGDAVAEIKANGNNLGVVSSSMFINNASVREDAAHKLYLDRNITLTPAVQPTSAVDIRLYIKGSEYLALKNASNSNGGPSGIGSLNDIGIFKNNDGCSQSVQGDLISVIPTTSDVWESDYVFSASISSFSSFYFANKAVSIPIVPTVSLTTPANNATYLAGGNVYLNASASDADGTISKVEFYNGATLLHTATDTPYSFKWEHVLRGNYTLTAKATDNNGLVSTSDSVHISVVANKPPTVNIINPANGQTFLKGATIHLQAAAADPDGRITKVEFYNGTTLLTSEHKVPYTFDWRIGQSGNYTITARATDNWGAITPSAAINISVVPNQPPIVSIISPLNGQAFTAPATINLEAAAQDADGRIVQVSFYSGTTLLTNEHKLPYTYQWHNVTAGTYNITAVAKDNWSAETTSAPITVTVTLPGKPLVSSRSSIADFNTDVKSEAGLQLLPNPARNILNINTTGLQNNKRSTVSVISASGVVVKTMQTSSSIQAIQLNISSLANGMYILRLISGDKIMYRKFVKL